MGPREACGQGCAPSLPLTAPQVQMTMALCHPSANHQAREGWECQAPGLRAREVGVAGWVMSCDRLLCKTPREGLGIRHVSLPSTCFVLQKLVREDTCHLLR